MHKLHCESDGEVDGSGFKAYSKGAKRYFRELFQVERQTSIFFLLNLWHRVL